jgi:hypothetical protein
MPLLFTCPTCNVMIEITALNCGVFRCGIYKDNGHQINPHMPKDEVDKIKDDIYGCGNPFQISNNKIVKCAWI